MACLESRYGFSLETKEEHSRNNACVQLLDQPCSRVFDVTKGGRERNHALHRKRGKERMVSVEREDTRRACSISAKEEGSALSWWYRYLGGDNDRMAIAGVAVARFDPSFTRSRRASRHATACNTVERREMLNRG